MARQKAQGATTIKSWAEADKNLKRIGELNRKIAAEEAAATAIIEEAKAKLKKNTARAEGERTNLLHDLEAFAINHKNDLTEEAGKKSIELNHGKLGFRKSTKIKVAGKVAKALELLKAAKDGMKYIRVKETINKEAMRELGDDRLLEFRMRREVSDDFWCEPAETTAKSAPRGA